MLSVTNPDSGSAIEELEVDYDATPLEIGFNARYLIDIANQLDSDTRFVQAERFRLADHCAGPRRRQCALRAHADARVGSCSASLLHR